MIQFSCTPNHLRYTRALQSNNDIIVCTGPSSTGKILIPCRIASMKKLKIIITRPSKVLDVNIEYLPGAWTQSMYKVFNQNMSQNEINRLISIEPLDNLRGVQLDNVFIIATDMQNSTQRQMNALIDKKGINTKLVITGQLEYICSNNGLFNIVQNIDKTQMEYVSLDNMDTIREVRDNNKLKLYIF